jgi:hypothetical protein
MIYGIITCLIYALLVVAFIQPNAPRLFAAVSFAAIISSHELLLSDLEGLQYYGSAALFDLAIIILTSGINPVPKMVLSLHRICITSILANLAGWVLWLFYYPPLAYDATFAAIYVWALVTLIKRDGLHGMVGGYTMDSWATCFRFNRRPWYSYLSNHGGKI